MGLRIRALVAVILALISLSVLSLHVALCFHYPSALFAVTLLLNPSLWLFVGLMSMFCTLLLSLRDRRRKLVPALCTSCRPRVESSHIWTSRNRFYHRRWREHGPCRCSERSLLACYSSDSSVHTTTQLLSTASDVSQVHGTGSSSKNVISTENDDGGSLLSIESSYKDSLVGKENKKDSVTDVQNFSCLLRNDSFPEKSRNSLVVLGKDGSTKSMFSERDVREVPVGPDIHRKNSSRLVFCSYANDRYQLYATTKRLEYNKVLRANTFSQRHHNSTKTLTSQTEGDDFSRPVGIISNFSLENTSSQDKDSGSSVSELNNPINSSISETVDSSDSSQTPLTRRDESICSNELPKRINRYSNLSRCTCPARYYLNYGSRAPLTSKTNKPLMKCTKTLKSATPVHLFQVDGKKSRGSSRDNIILDDQSVMTRNSPSGAFENGRSDDEDDLSLEVNVNTASCSSIASLLPK